MENIPVKDTVPAQQERYSWQEKAEVARLYLANGNMRIVSEVTNIPYPTLSAWKKSDWWPTLIDELKAAKKARQGVAIDRALELGLEFLVDRLENGDYILNNKTGKIERKPVSVRELTTTVNALLTRQTQMEELSAKMQHTENSMQDILAALAKEFKKFNRIQQQEVAETIEYKEL